MIPYFISSHPGSTLEDACELSVFLKKNGFVPDQVQDFYPTPGTLSTCMFYTGYHPLTMEKVYVPKSSEEKAMQRALLQYFMPKNKPLVLKALRQAKRLDLIGTGPNCLVRLDGPSSNPQKQATKQTKGKRGTKWQKGKTTTKRKTGKRN